MSDDSLGVVAGDLGASIPHTSLLRIHTPLNDRRLWATAGRAAHPQASVLNDALSYGGEWKALLRDGNRRNRSALFEWEVENCLGDARRRYSPAFELEDYTFQVGGCMNE